MNYFLTGIIVILQSWFFYKSWVNLKRYKAIFPFEDIDKYELMGTQLRVPSSCTDNYKFIVNSTNMYLEKNEGTADFSLLKDIAERKVELVYEQATSKLSFPMYLGLMGTFLGVGYGLYSLNDSGNIVMESQHISNFIGGVIVAMFTSFVGLALTTRANWLAANCQEELNKKKDAYFSFLQTELLPEMGTSIVQSLSQLKGTIGGFERSFTKVIDRFEHTFTDLTQSFGDGFRENINSIQGAVNSLGKNMHEISATMQLQKSLLAEIRSEEMVKSVKSIHDIFKEFETIVPLLKEFQIQQILLSKATVDLAEKQDSFNNSLEVPQQILENLNCILNRVSTFEQNINALGETLSDSQFLGSKQVNLIEKQLDSLEQKQKLAVRYTNNGTVQLEEYYAESIEKIEKLRHTFENQIKTAFDFEMEGNSFKHLHHLVTISEVLPALKQEVKTLRDDVLVAKKDHAEEIIMAITQKKLLANMEFPNKPLDVNVVKKNRSGSGVTPTIVKKRPLFGRILAAIRNE